MRWGGGLLGLRRVAILLLEGVVGVWVGIGGGLLSVLVRVLEGGWGGGVLMVLWKLRVGVVLGVVDVGRICALGCVGAAIIRCIII